MSLSITFIGAGNMATSLAGGLVAKGYDPTRLTLSDISDRQLQQARSQLGVATERDNVQACAKADVIILAVKPQVMGDVVPPLAPIVQERHPLVISVAAGIPVSRLMHWFGPTSAIVRCMPNTPALVQLGATGLYANANVSAAQRETARQVLSSVGLALWLDSEDQIDAVTALSGSGPAYFFLVMEAMISAGQRLGLDESTARQLTLQTALGAAHMAISGDAEPAELRRRVTSPGGTTERAIAFFEEGQLRALFEGALTAARDRSRQLGNP